MLHSVRLRWEQEFLLAESEEVSGHAEQGHVARSR